MPFSRRKILAFLAALTLLSGATMTAPAPSESAAPPYTPAPAGVVIERDVSYLGAGRTETGDIYRPAERVAGERLPGVVIIHGGGWTGGTKSAGREFNIGTTLAKAGYVCLSVDYRLQKESRWPTNIYDCKNAVRFLRANAQKYGIDTEHIGVIGGSAGGHLALMVAYTPPIKALEPPAPYPGVSDRVQAVVDMYGIMDVRTGVKTDAEGSPTAEPRSWNAVFGDHAPITDADLALASPVSHIGAHCPPTLVLHGTHDTIVDRNQSLDLSKKLAAARVPHKLIVVRGIGHTFDLQTWNKKPLPQDLRPVVTVFLDTHLKSAKDNGAK